MSHVSIILTLANAESRWPELAKVILSAVRHHDEVIVVDNASRDATAAKAKAAGVKVVSLKQRTSDGVALQAGIDAAKHDTLLLIDPHHSLDLAADLALMLAQAQHPPAEVVQGIRATRRHDPDHSLRALATLQLARYASEQLFTDPASSWALCRKSTLTQLGIQNEELRYVALVAASRGAKVAAIPLSAPASEGQAKTKLTGQQAIDIFFELTSFLLVVAWTLFKRNPLHSFGIPAMYLGTLALGFFILAFLSLLAGVFVTSLWAGTAGLTFIAVQFLAVGLMGEVFKRMKATYAPAYILGEAATPSLPVPVIKPAPQDPAETN